MNFDFPLFFRFRDIRVTASICLEFAKNPSTFIKNYWWRIHQKELKTAPIEWGKKHENTAFEVCLEMFKDVKKCGFFVSKKFPQFGCSPDGIIPNEWLIEIKCPFLLKDTTPTDLSKLSAAQKRSFFLVETPYGVQLDKKHKYHYQCQWQMFVTGLKKLKFIV